MGRIFVLITQLRNQTNRQVGFQVDLDGYCRLPDLPPGKTRNVKLSRILQCYRKRGSSWKIPVLHNKQSTQIELDSSDLLKCVRIVFTWESIPNGNGSCELRVKGVEENLSDYFFRLKYFGCVRNRFWSSRPSYEIPRADSIVAGNLRDIEEARGPHLSPVAETTLVNGQYASPVRTGDTHEGDGPRTNSLALPRQPEDRRAHPSRPVRKSGKHDKKRKRNRPVDHKSDQIKGQPNVTAAVWWPEEPRTVPYRVVFPLQRPQIMRSGGQIGIVDTDQDSSSTADDQQSSTSSSEPTGPQPPQIIIPRGQIGIVDTDQDSSSTADDHESSTSTGDIGEAETINRPVRKEIRGFDHVGTQRSSRREQSMEHDPRHMDSFVYAFLFLSAFSLVWFLPLLFVP